MIEEVLRNPDAAERRSLLDTLALAFRDNPMNVEIHGASPTRRVRANRAGLRALVQDGQRGTETRAIRYDGRVIGGWVATGPGAERLPRPSMRRQIGCFIHQGARAMDQWGEVNRCLSAFRPSAPHWYVAVLGVHPEFWGRGFGGRLLDGLAEVVARRPAPIYLESDREASVRFYRGRGFEDRAKLRVHGVPCWCLGRGFG